MTQKQFYTSVSNAISLDQFCSTPFGERKIWRLCQVSVVRCWRMSLNLISKYLFLEQKAQSLEEVLTFLTKAGGSIHIFSESTHIEALIKPCKMMKIKKKSYLYNSTIHPPDLEMLSRSDWALPSKHVLSHRTHRLNLSLVHAFKKTCIWTLNQSTTLSLRVF